MTYNEWAAVHPAAACDLNRMLGSVPLPAVPEGGDGKSEAWAQQSCRLDASKSGAMSWRNNVGATPAKCPDCGTPRQPIRFGLANDSKKLNETIKSSDLILAIPRRITPAMVGTTMAQFGAVETKRPGWHYTGTKQEPAQAAWLALITRLGGFATFSTGDLTL